MRSTRKRLRDSTEINGNNGNNDLSSLLNHERVFVTNDSFVTRVPARKW